MRSAFLILVVLVVLGLGAGFLSLGAFPPTPHTQSVDKLIPPSAVPAG